jgi:hypothetical protein
MIQAICEKLGIEVVKALLIRDADKQVTSPVGLVIGEDDMWKNLRPLSYAVQ